MYQKIFIYSIAFFLLSCKGKKSDLQDVLQSSNSNRGNIEQIIEYYKADSLKLKATIFLISNMKELYTLNGNSMDQYYNTMNVFQEQSEQMNVFELRAFSDSIIQMLDFSKLEKEYDLNSIKPDYLIRRIDHAFKVWEMPWAKDLNFEEFCEYLLPYRVGTEVLEDWQEDLGFYFKGVLDETDLQSDSTIYDFCGKLSAKYKTNLYSYPSGMPTIKPSRLKYQRIGPCEDFANLFVFIGRTFGIPTAIDFTPQWANHSQGHVWSVAIYKGKTLYYMLGEGMPQPANERKFTYKLPKAYRRMNKIQPNSLAVLASEEIIPPFFRNPRIKDVTEEYVQTTNLSIKKMNKLEGRGKRIYASVFDDKNWVPVAWGDIKKDEATIFNIGYPAIYLPVYYIDDRYIAAQYPVMLDEGGLTHYLKPDKKKMETIVLKRKFMDNRAWQFVESLKGGKFQLANNKRFKNPIEFNIPDTVGYNYQKIHMENGKKYRYIRYLPKPETSGDIAEIEIYNREGNLINGQIIGTYSYTKDAIHGIEKVFDGEALTYALCDKTRNDQWIGLDLGEPTEISKILYLSRSDDNFIKDNEQYELFYWDNKWLSLGKQRGNKQTQVLIYNNVPANSLLLLRNLSKGKEERIFTYEHGRQVWW